MSAAQLGVPLLAWFGCGRVSSKKLSAGFADETDGKENLEHLRFLIACFILLIELCRVPRPFVRFYSAA